jgi:hypothetical protein
MGAIGADADSRVVSREVLSWWKLFYILRVLLSKKTSGFNFYYWECPGNDDKSNAKILDSTLAGWRPIMNPSNVTTGEKQVQVYKYQDENTHANNLRACNWYKYHGL